MWKLAPWLVVLAPLTQESRPPLEGEGIDAGIRRSAELLLGLQESLDEDDAAPLAEWPYEGVYRKNGRIPIGYRIGGTAIGAWALLAAPGWDAAPERRAAVERALDFVLAGLDDPRMDASFEVGYDVRGWGHAYALTFLLELRAADRVPGERSEAVDAAVTRLVGLLEDSEIEDGGWNYARRDPAKASPFMTAPTLLALFEAAEQGEAVDPAVVARALDRLAAGRLESGAVQYKVDPERATGEGREEVPGAIGRMAATETALLVAGRGSVARVRAALDAFFEHWPWLEKRRKQNGTHVPPYGIAPYYFFYAHFYAAQAIELLPADERPAYRARLLALLDDVREESGGWNDRVFPRSENFGTAMVLLALTRPSATPLPAWRPRRAEK